MSLLNTFCLFADCLTLGSFMKLDIMQDISILVRRLSFTSVSSLQTVMRHFLQLLATSVWGFPIPFYLVAYKKKFSEQREFIPFGSDISATPKSLCKLSATTLRILCTCNLILILQIPCSVTDNFLRNFLFHVYHITVYFSGMDHVSQPYFTNYFNTDLCFFAYGIVVTCLNWMLLVFNVHGDVIHKMFCSVFRPCGIIRTFRHFERTSQETYPEILEEMCYLVSCRILDDCYLKICCKS
jgi:hypothetical protein